MRTREDLIRAMAEFLQNGAPEFEVSEDERVALLTDAGLWEAIREAARLPKMGASE